MSGIEPNGKLGGEEAYLARLTEAMGYLGKFVGWSIYVTVLLTIITDLGLDMVFLIGQPKPEGTSLSWLSWVFPIIQGVGLTGLQYALFSNPCRTFSLGWWAGWSTAIIDTVTDAGGSAAVLSTGFSFPPDASELTLGIMPAPGSHFGTWVIYLVIPLVCFFHEPYFSKVLKRDSFDPGPGGASSYAVNLLAMLERAGIMFNRTRLFTIVASPFAMLLFDVSLTPIMIADVNKEVNLAEIIGSVLVTATITAVVISGWEMCSYLKGRAFRLWNLTVPYKVILGITLTLSIVDGGLDLCGYNQVVYGQPTPWPATLGLIIPYLLTSIVLLIVTVGNEVMISHIFAPLGRADTFEV